MCVWVWQQVGVVFNSYALALFIDSMNKRVRDVFAVELVDE